MNLIDDYGSFEFHNTSTASTLYANQMSNEDLFGKRLQLLDDSAFFREYRNIVDISSSSSNLLIPSDLIKVFKNIIENSNYIKSESSNQLKTFSKEDLLKLMKNQFNLSCQTFCGASTAFFSFLF